MVAQSSLAATGQIPTQWHFGADSEHALRLTGSVQLWLRHTDLNPGSAVSDVATDSETDISIRRLRAGAWLTFDERSIVRLNAGFNNFNRLTRGDVDLKLLDAYAEH